ncbi:MAG: aquaporin [Nocardioidaceae bacterium]
MRAYVSELLGSTLFVMAVLTATLSGSDLAPVAVGAALLALVYTCAPMSGAHLNPALSLATVIRGTLPVVELVPYLAAQLLGGLVAYLLTAGIYGDQIDALPGPVDLSGLVVAAFLVELVFSFALAWVYLGTLGRLTGPDATVEARDHQLGPAGLAIGGIVAAGTVAAGPISGAALNPVVTFAMGLTGILDWKWVPIYVLAQLLGALLASLITLGTLPARPDTPTPPNTAG